MIDSKSLHGRKIAIDASMAIYQFLIAVRSGGHNQAAVQLTNADGETTSHIQGLFNRTIRFISEGIKPVYVFDGKPPSFKSGELKKRREKREKAAAALRAATEEGDVEEQDKQSKRLVRAGTKENDDCKRLLELMGVPIILAPCEAEAQAASMAKAGLVCKFSVIKRSKKKACLLIVGTLLTTLFLFSAWSQQTQLVRKIWML